MGNKGKGTWLSRQKQDPYYRKAKEEGLRSRSAFKLQHVNQKYPIFLVKHKFAAKILDLGCSPGSWIEEILLFHSHTPQEQRSANFKVLGIDTTSIRPFDDTDAVEFFRGDVFTDTTEAKIQSMQPFNVILSDLSPKTGGNPSDIAIQESMVEKVLEFVEKYLTKHGNIVIKLFQSKNSQGFIDKYQNFFHLLKFMKPEASRLSSREIYLVGLNYSGGKPFSLEPISSLPPSTPEIPSLPPSIRKKSSNQDSKKS